jgi:hypothetical protein
MDASRALTADTEVDSGIDDDPTLDMEFWDACWTLDDEWQPRMSRPRAPARRRLTVTATVNEVHAL